MSKGPYSKTNKTPNPAMDSTSSPPPAYPDLPSTHPIPEMPNTPSQKFTAEAYPDLPPTPPASDSGDTPGAKFPTSSSFQDTNSSDPFTSDFSEEMPPKFAAEAAAFSILNQLDRKEGEAIGILYCSSCGQYFGNVKHLQRHFMFSRKHGEEPRQLRDLYYKLWGNSWKTEAKRGGDEGVESGIPAGSSTHPPPAYVEAMEVDDDESAQSA